MDEITTSRLTIEIGASSDRATKQIKDTIDALKSLRKQTNVRFQNPIKSLDGKGFDAAKLSSKLHSVDAQIAKTQKKIDDLRNEIDGLSSAGNTKGIPALETQISSYQRLLQALGTQKTQLQSIIPSGEVGRAKGLAGLLQSLKSKIKLRIDSSDADKAHKRVRRLSNILSSLKRIAFYRAIRSVIKGIGQAFSVGVENAYWYSKTVGGEIGYVAEAFDRLSSAGFKADNQLGAALASLKAAVVPILIEIIRWVTIAADKLTQLFAILGGHTTYLKAVDYTKEAYENTAAGAAAAKEWKNQLMGFDEINRLEEPSSGGGGGGSAVPDYENMFEQAEVEDWALRFKAIWDEKIYPTLSKIYNFIKEKIWPYIEKLFNFIVENIDWLLPLAAKVGLAILGWKLGKGLITGLGSVSRLLGKIHSKAGLVAIALAGIAVAGVGAYDAWNNGVDWQNTGEYLGGAAVAAGALGIAFGATTAAATGLVGSLGALVIGIRDWVKEGRLSLPTFGLIEGGIAGISAAAAGLAGGGAAFGPAALVAAPVAAIPAAFLFVQSLTRGIGLYAQGIKEVDERYKQLGKTFERTNWLGETKVYADTPWQRGMNLFRDLFDNVHMSALREALARRAAIEDGIFGDYVRTRTNYLEQRLRNSDGLIGKLQADRDKAILALVQVDTKKLQESTNFMVRLIGDGLAKADKEIKQYDAGFATTASSLDEKLQQMNSNANEKLNSITSLATGFVSKIKKAFDFQWEIPAPKVPHISIVPEQVFGDLRSMFGINAIPRFRVEMFAAGGFPEDGLFMANHGELVGKFSNGKTAVANNDQITEGISRAVYEAFVDAMTQTGGDGGNKEVHIYLDGRQIAETTTKYQRQFARAAG